MPAQKGQNTQARACTHGHCHETPLLPPPPQLMTPFVYARVRACVCMCVYV